MTVRLLFVALLVIGSTGPALAQRTVAADTGVADYEYYHPPQVGSHGVFVGLVSATSDRAADPVRLFVYVPPQGADSVCVDLVSRNGYYGGRFRFVRPAAGGMRTLLLPTRFARELRGLGPGRLAPLVHVSPTCSGNREVTLVAGWGEGASARRLRLLLNPGEVVEVRVQAPGGVSTCARINETATTAYNHACNVAVSGAGGYVPLTILARTFAGPRQPIRVRLWVPDGHP
jgi:hypothetical protein